MNMGGRRPLSSAFANRNIQPQALSVSNSNASLKNNLFQDVKKLGFNERKDRILMRK